MPDTRTMTLLELLTASDFGRADPARARELLDLAMESRSGNRRKRGKREKELASAA